MYDKITRGVSYDSSGPETDGSTANGGGNSPLGEIGQDKDGDGKSGNSGKTSGGSLQAPGHFGPEYVVLGAKPRKKSEKKAEGEPTKRRKGVEWNKKDRKAARVYRGQGQKMAARAASETKNQVSKVGALPKSDGLLAVRIPEKPRDPRGHSRAVWRKVTLWDHINADFRRHGIVGAVSIIFLLLLAIMGPPIVLILFALDNIAKSENSSRGSASSNGSFVSGMSCVVIMGALAYLLLATTSLMRLFSIPCENPYQGKKRKK
ncbi:MULTISPECIES: hypothetical protein [Candidatus Ichthyocystis]|uniref:hypothetical protein n=1 Tax=Candidatus Ichthyocystis TaxID=2929841 RepID=UPI00111190CE|nr:MULTISPECIES: hypothetical protein [Ichthyocystis]